MNYSDFIDQLRVMLNDVGGAIYSDDELLLYSYQGVLDVSLESIASNDKNFVTAGYISYGQDLPTNFIRFAGNEQIYTANSKAYPEDGTVHCKWFSVNSPPTDSSDTFPLNFMYEMRCKLKALSYAIRRVGYDSTEEMGIADRLLSAHAAAMGMFTAPPSSSGGEKK